MGPSVGMSAVSPAVQVVLLAQGDGAESLAAKERLLAQYDPLILKVTRRFRFGDHLEEDIIQVGKLAVLEQIGAFDTGRGTSFGRYVAPFILGAARKVRDSSYRPEARKDPLTETEAMAVVIDLLHEQRGRACEAENEIGFREVEVAQDLPALQAAVRSFVETLSERQRQVVELVFWQGLSQADAARLLGITRAAVGKLLTKVFEKGRVDLARYAAARPAA